MQAGYENSMTPGRTVLPMGPQTPASRVNLLWLQHLEILKTAQGN